MKKKSNLQLAYERNARAVYRQTHLTKTRSNQLNDYLIDKFIKIEKKIK